MFERYTEPARRAIFFARLTALHEKAGMISPDHLLAGILSEKSGRANMLFHLRELFAEDAARQDVIKKKQLHGHLPLSYSSKRVLAYVAEESGILDDHWIDTEHLLLGILRETDCDAASRLRRAGIQPDGARQTVMDNKSSRPVYGPVPNAWNKRRWGQALAVFSLAVVVALVIFALQR